MAAPIVISDRAPPCSVHSSLCSPHTRHALGASTSRGPPRSYPTTRRCWVLASGGELPVKSSCGRTVESSREGFAVSRRYFSEASALTLVARPWELLSPERALAEKEAVDFVLYKCGEPAPVPCLEAKKKSKTGKLDITDGNFFTPDERCIIGGYAIKSVPYSLWVPSSMRPLTGYFEGGPDPTGSLDMRLEDATLGVVIVASPPIKVGPWIGKSTIEEAGTPQEVITALDGGKGQLAQTQVRPATSYTGAAGRQYYLYELVSKSSPIQHRFITATVVDGKLILLTCVGRNSVTWPLAEEPFRAMAQSFRVLEDPAPAP